MGRLALQLSGGGADYRGCFESIRIDGSLITFESPSILTVYPPFVSEKFQRGRIELPSHGSDFGRSFSRRNSSAQFIALKSDSKVQIEGICIGHEVLNQAFGDKLQLHGFEPLLRPIRQLYQRYI